MDEAKTSETLLQAVMNQDKTAVRAFLEARADLEERGSKEHTPLTLAGISDQFVVAELLIDAGANIWAYNRFGWTVGYAADTSRLAEGSEAFEAKERVIAKLKQKGFPFPAPEPEMVIEAAKADRWPPRRRRWRSQ